jgi:hypothetical protein
MGERCRWAYEARVPGRGCGAHTTYLTKDATRMDVELWRRVRVAERYAAIMRRDGCSLRDAQDRWAAELNDRVAVGPVHREKLAKLRLCLCRACLDSGGGERHEGPVEGLQRRFDLGKS